MILLRAHHLLCTVLYKGNGYSDTFVENMNEVVARLHNPQEDVKIIMKPDAICADCPNAKYDGSCALDDEKQPDSYGKIDTLDEHVIRYFGLEAGTVKKSSELFTIASDKMTEGFFDESCGSCRWRKMGLCSYDEYMERVKTFMEKERST